MGKRRRVLAFGTFDLLHPGHLYYLEHAARLGSELVVVVARDANAERSHGTKPFLGEKHRLELVSALKFVDRAVLGDKTDFHKPLLALKPDVIALGYDQKANTSKLLSKLREKGISPKIARISALRPSVYKSSKIRARVECALGLK